MLWTHEAPEPPSGPVGHGASGVSTAEASRAPRAPAVALGTSSWVVGVAGLPPATAPRRRVVVPIVTLAVALAVALTARATVGLGHHRDIGRGRGRATEATAVSTAEATPIAAAEAASIPAVATAAAIARGATRTTIEAAAAAAAVARRTTRTTIEPGATARAITRRPAIAAGTSGAAGTPVIPLDARGATIASVTAGRTVEAARTATTTGALLRLVHAQRASVEVGAVHRSDRRLRLGLGGQFDECEATRSARLAVHHQEDIRHRTPVGAERISEGLFSRAVCQVAYVESRSHCEAQGPSAAHRSIVSSFTRAKVSS